MNANARHVIMDQIHSLPVSSSHLSCNPNVSLSYVINHPEINWNWHDLSSNPGISFRDILDHPECPWNYDYVSQNPSIQFSDVMNYMDKPWNYHELSSNLTLTMCCTFQPSPGAGSM